MHRMRQILVSTVLLLAGAAHASTANLSLTSAGAQAVQTSETTWLLEKAGARNGGTVSWVIGATPQQTLANQLVLVGHVTVTNSGTGPATVGNVVVNLQTREGKQWVTRSTDVADATDGDDAIAANIHKAASSEGKATFTENSASGKLEFMDATNNTVFSLVPQVSIPAGVSRTMLFKASFDNNVLNLAVGTQIRSETIVSFGNATVNGNGTANVDINGNGTIDADEARVRSIPSRLTLTVPAAINGNSTPTLTDTIDDVATTGTVTFTNAQFNLGATSGTVTATVDGGTDGGTITNCARLTTPDITVSSGGSTFTTVPGLDLQTCSQIQVGSVTPCQPGEVGCRWRTGDLNTRTQGAWDDTTSWYAAYDAIYSSTFGVVEVGLPGAAGWSMRFSGTGRVSDYLVQSGTPAALTTDLDDTTSSSSGQYGAEVLALRLNLDFSAAGQLGGTSGLNFGLLTLCNMTDASLNNTTVNGLLALANTLLGGSTSGSYTITAINEVLEDVNAAFSDATPSTFASASLYNGACPWNSGDLVTYSQLQWGTASTTAGNLLGTNFVSLYGTSFVVGGIHTLTFRLADALFAYLPDSASAGVLTGSLLDPVSSSGGGQLAGEVIALQLNVDFSEANILSGVTSLGDLHFCNTGLSTLDGLTVSEFLSIANTLLGGGSAPYNVSVATGVASTVNDAFAGGVPSSFAQTNLFSLPCAN